MAATGILLRRDTKANLLLSPPVLGELVFATDTLEVGCVGTNDTVVWEKFGKPSTYELALAQGFTGTQEDFVGLILSESDYDVALRLGFVGTQEEWVIKLSFIAVINESDSGKILSNDGTNAKWVSINEQLNTQTIQWDLGEL